MKLDYINEVDKMVGSRERKRCPKCKSVSIEKKHGKRNSGGIPHEYRYVPHYRCIKCGNRFFNPIVKKVDGYNRSSHRRVDYKKVEKLYSEGNRDEVIAQELECSCTTVMRWRWKHGHPPHSMDAVITKKPPRHTDVTSSQYSTKRSHFMYGVIPEFPDVSIFTTIFAQGNGTLRFACGFKSGRSVVQRGHKLGVWE